MNIVFLDIDGVLNSATSIVGHGMSRNEEDPTLTNLSIQSVGILRYMCSNIPDYSIYVHSSWTKWDYVTDEYVKTMLSHHGFPNANVLPIDRDTVYMDRAQRISKAIERLSPDGYVILDDFNMTEIFGDNQVTTDAWVGLSYTDLFRVKNPFPDIIVPIVML